MRYLLIFFVVILQTDVNDLSKVRWIHGTADCATNKDALIQVVQYDESTWILRQNKCTHYEAPFMFLFLGELKALLMDTGATTDDKAFPLYTTVREIISKWETKNRKSIELVIAHTHSHDDHWSGDAQFRGKDGVIVAGIEGADVISFFGLKNWPLQSQAFDLGDRKLEIIPIPGHDRTSIAVYDAATEILLTGDTFYPGRLYVRDWDAFRASIQRLFKFATSHEVNMLIGNHIEMSNAAGKDYPAGSTYQPDEAPLPLTVRDLRGLNDFLTSATKPERKVFDKFIVSPK